MVNFFWALTLAVETFLASRVIHFMSVWQRDRQSTMPRFASSSQPHLNECFNLFHSRR